MPASRGRMSGIGSGSRLYRMDEQLEICQSYPDGRVEERDDDPRVLALKEDRWASSRPVAGQPSWKSPDGGHSP